MKHPWRQVATQQLDDKLRRSVIWIGLGVNPRERKTQDPFWRDFCRTAGKNHDKTKMQYIKFTL